MKGKLFALAVLSVASASALAEGYTYQSGGPQTRVPDNATIVAAPAVVTPAPAVVTPAPAASASTTYVVPSNPPHVVAASPTVVATAPAIAAPSSPWITQQPGQSGPGAVDKVRPGFDDSSSHSAWDVGT